MIHFKRYMLLLLALLCLLACVSGCAKQEEEETIYYTVSFNSNGGSPIESQTVAEHGRVSPVTPPTREGYLFDGWKSEHGSFWNFESDVPTSDMTLTATWISATSVFAYEPLNDTDAMLTEIKEQRADLPVPQILGGYTITAIGDGVFSEISSSKVQSISLPSTVTSIGEDAFAGCENITISFAADAVLTELGAGAFLDCNRLGSITLGEGLETIYADTFFGCSSLKEIRIPKSVTRLEDNAFSDCTSLMTVMLSSEVTEIGDSAFKGCTSLRTVYYYGTEEQLAELRTDNTAKKNDPFLYATAFFYSATQPTSDGNYWYLNDQGRPKLW